MLVTRAVGMQVMQLLCRPEEWASLAITTNLKCRQWVRWVTAMLTDRRLQGDGSEAMYVAVESNSVIELRAGCCPRAPY